MPLRVCLFEDNRSIRESLALLVDSNPELELCGAYPDAGNILEHMAAARPDVVLMDIEMPGMNGIEAVRMLRAEFPAITVLMQTVFDEDEKVFDAICAGASGYLLKNTPPAQIMQGIVEAAAGGSPMSPAIARKTLNLFQKYMGPLAQAPGKDYGLTNREKEVLQLLVDGNSYKLIAARCGISFETVRAHVRNVYQKLHVASSTEAVSKALRERLI